MDSQTDFLPHVPAAAVAYCRTLHRQYGFDFRTSRPRRSKWGDYRYRQSAAGATHTITVNEDLNPYAFLITYLHEVAHLVAFRQHGFRISPHGPEWQRCFGQLLQPVLTPAVFPRRVLLSLRDYAVRPKATTGADPRLTLALRNYDTTDAGILLAHLPVGTRFRFRQRTYVKQRTRRTRALCQEVITHKHYLILETTWVECLLEHF